VCRIGVAFYIWIGVFNMVAVAQFWAFANDIYNSERGKRLFPLVGVGATLGAALGSLVATLVFGGIGPYVLMLIAAAGLLVPIASPSSSTGVKPRLRRDAQVVSEQPSPKAATASSWC
jgi:MFS family permease